jgi:hypothetical protein
MVSQVQKLSTLMPRNKLSFVGENSTRLKLIKSETDIFSGIGHLPILILKR